MSSLEIAELTGKRHADVIRDIEKMFESLDIAERSFASGYKDANNQERKCYKLDKELTLTLVSGYNIKLRNSIIKRWQALEGPAKPMSQLEIMQVMIGKQIEQEAINTQMDQRITQLEQSSNVLKPVSLISVRDYCMTYQVALIAGANLVVGRLCTKHCRENNISMTKINAWKNHTVNAYPNAVIKNVLKANADLFADRKDVEKNKTLDLFPMH